jgi:glycosyltransferase involved in cell wall biosynthesis
VATAVGGLPDLLDRGALGRLTPAGDAATLTPAVAETLAAPPAPAQAQTAMLHRYSIDRLARDLEELYRALLRK